MRKPTWKVLLTASVAVVMTGVTGVVLADSSESLDQSDTSTDSALPFDMPSSEELRASDKKVFAHYFTQYPLSHSDQPPDEDYYERHYLNPDGEDGIHAEYGGLLRDRPLPRDPIGEEGWEIVDMKTEITRAHEAGIDGFTLDMLSIEKSDNGVGHWERMEHLLTAAKEVEFDFDIVLMPDMNTRTIVEADQAELAAAVVELAEMGPAYELDDSRLVVAPFRADNRSPEWWSEFLSIMENDHDLPSAFVPMFLNVNDINHGDETNFDAYKSISYGMSEMSVGSPGGQEGMRAKIANAHEEGLMYMPSLAPQDTRPDQANYYEANNTENFRVGWETAIDADADWVQLMTWNDYRENHQVSPSVANDWLWLDLTSYYLVNFKTGSYPEIVRDTAYLTHRKHFTDDLPSSGNQTLFQELRSNGGEPSDDIEILTFLTDEATVTASIASDTSTYEAPSGVHAETFPLAFGNHGASVDRDGSTTVDVESPWLVTDEFESQDLLYWAASSAR